MQVTYLKMASSRILKINKIDLLIALDVMAIVASLLWLHHSNVDLKLQSYLFDFHLKSWMIDAKEPVKKFIFYDFPKIIFAIILAFCLFAAVVSFKKKSGFFVHNRHKFLITLLGLALIPLIAGNIKKFTNIYCPSQLEIYGGEFRYVKIFEKYPVLNGVKIKSGQCFPAGHAVTGFALIILFFVLEKKVYRIFGLLGAVIIGWVLGFYQMAKGVHFFGDTLIAMLICFLIAAIITRIYEIWLAKSSN